MNLTRNSLSTLFCALLLTACGDGNAAPKANQQPAGPAAAQPLPAPPTPEVLAKLKAADEFDGKEDKVVSKCPACKLGMDGKADHELKVGEYTLMFCSADQEKAWAADPNKAILALEIPPKPPTPANK